MEQAPTPYSPGILIVTRNPLLRVVGSLWFAAVLLMMLLVGMACATVYESAHGTEQALAVFYRSWWFHGLLALLAVNVAGSVIIRYPFSRRQSGFVITHVGILVILGGALVTDTIGVNGRIGLFEGNTTDVFTAEQGSTLSVVNQQDQARSAVNLVSQTFCGVQAVEHPPAPILNLGDLHVEVQRFIPDGAWEKQVVDDHPGIQPAVEVLLSSSGEGSAVWLFADQADSLGEVQAIYRPVADSDELARLFSTSPEDEAGSSGLVKVEYAGSTFDVPLGQALEQAVPLGDTGTTLRVLRYLPDATVKGKQLVNASDEPKNPAIEVEIVGPAGSERRPVFAKFPNFQSMHGKPHGEELKVTLTAPRESVARAPVEIIGGLEGELYVRFNRAGDEPVISRFEVGDPVESPWPGKQLLALRRFEHARVNWVMREVHPPRGRPEPALLLQINTTTRTNRMWVQKYTPRTVTVDGVTYEMVYSNRNVPLGFELTLDRFHLGYYPGSMRPRSFESHVTIADPTTGWTQSRIISMNHPVKYRGYTMYQSSYSKGKRQTASFLSVARDPGQPIVFAGYITTLLGMVVVLGVRVSDRRRKWKMENGK